MLSSRQLDQADGTCAYGLIERAMDAARIPFDHRPTLMIMEMSSPFIRDLRKSFGKFGKVNSQEGTRFDGPYGDRYVEGGLAYRIS